MSLQAHTNKPGTFPLWKEFVQEAVNAQTGAVWRGVVTFRVQHSVKSTPVRPEWIKSNGLVVFKKPSNFLRVVDNRTNPTINGRKYDSSGRLIETYQTYAQTRSGNSPALTYMPRIMVDDADEPFWDSNQIHRCEVECLLKFKEDGVALGNALAEAKSTVDSIAETTVKLVRGLSAMKRGNVRAAWRAVGGNVGLSKFAADNYLQWKFGWAPLMSDIKDGVDTLKKQLRIDDKIVRNVRQLEYENTWSPRVGAVNPGSFNQVEGKGTHKTKVALWCKFKPDKWRQAAEAYGLDDPLGILWEVTPWSFVVDWVMPVGNLLSALAVRERLDFVGGFASVVAQGTNRISVPVWPDPYFHENKVDAKIERFGFRRVAYSSLPFPMPYVKSPLSTSHTVTAIALLRQLVR